MDNLKGSSTQKGPAFLTICTEISRYFIFRFCKFHSTYSKKIVVLFHASVTTIESETIKPTPISAEENKVLSLIHNFKC